VGRKCESFNRPPGLIIDRNKKYSSCSGQLPLPWFSAISKQRATKFFYFVVNFKATTCEVNYKYEFLLNGPYI
jgi:hypothetical protein